MAAVHDWLFFFLRKKQKDFHLSTLLCYSLHRESKMHHIKTQLFDSSEQRFGHTFSFNDCFYLECKLGMLQVGLSDIVWIV